VLAVYGIIPARLKSTRLPGKLLLNNTGKPLIQYIWEASLRAKALSTVLVAAEDDELIAAVTAFGGRAEATGEHPSGTDRVAEVVARSLPDAEIVVNLQGDEPELDPANIDRVVTALQQHPTAQIATLATPIQNLAELQTPSCVKVVRGLDGRALYFSRSVVPYTRDRSLADQMKLGNPWLLHVGIYAYRRDYLLRLASLPPSPLEQLEKLEQLRALEDGARIQVEVVDHRSVGIDTPEDYAAFELRMRQRQSSV
jgi:3-deoxy-manno-octulosonate cytidylyltransferase (CMP-KDO synthetase)